MNFPSFGCARLLAICLATAACGGDKIELASQQPSALTRDSSGVQIIEVNSDPWKAGEWAIVDTINVVRLKGADTVAGSVFQYLAWAEIMSDGNIIASDWESGEVSVFSPGGAFVRRIGMKGEGPGEFETPLQVLPGPGDSLHVADPGKRIDVFSREGKFGRRVRLGEGNHPLIVLKDGSYIAVRGDDFELSPGKHPSYSTIYRLMPNGDTTAVIAKYLRDSTTYQKVGRSHEEVQQIFQPNRYAYGTMSGFLWCDAGTFICDKWSSEGRKIGSLRIMTPPAPVTKGDIAAWTAKRTSLQKTLQGKAAVEKAVASADIAATFPFYGLYRVDPADRIWFSEYSRDGKPTQRWTVVTQSGDVLGTVQLPNAARMLKIGDGIVIFLDRGKDDEQILAIYKYALTSKSGEKTPPQ